MGMSILEFWEITPYEFSLCVAGYIQRNNQQRDDMVTAAYLSVWFDRHKKLPKLKKFLVNKPKRKVMAAEKMAEIVKAMNAALGGKVVYREEES